METPVDPFPVGWFSVGQAAGLRAGEVRPLRQHGRHLVLWRDESGEAHLLDVPTVWREIAENGIDLTHFHYLHGVEGVSELVFGSAEGPVWRSRCEHAVRTPLGSRPASFDYELHGPGYGWLRFTIEGAAEIVFLITIVPIEVRLLELTFHFLRRITDDPGRREMTGALVREVIDQITDDVPIWTHKIIKDPPMLARGDGPIAQLRRWSASFSRADRTLTAAAHGESGE
jgi:3-ketosteroid 9alpha-monooxygenase subunit A